MRTARFISRTILFSLLAAVSTAMSAQAGTCQSSHTYLESPHKVTYSKQNSSPGDKIEIGGEEFIIVRMPFVEFKSGDRYALSFPVPANTTNATLWSVSTHHYKAKDCSDVHVTGLPNEPHKLGTSETRTITWNRLSHNFSSTRVVSTSLSAQIGETLVGLTLSIPTLSGILTKEEIPPTATSPADFDLVDNVNFSKLEGKPKKQLKNLDKIIDYIFIKKIN